MAHKILVSDSKDQGAYRFFFRDRLIVLRAFWKTERFHCLYMCQPEWCQREFVVVCVLTLPSYFWQFCDAIQFENEQNGEKVILPVCNFLLGFQGVIFGAGIDFRLDSDPKDWTNLFGCIARWAFTIVYNTLSVCERVMGSCPRKRTRIKVYHLSWKFHRRRDTESWGMHPNIVCEPGNCPLFWVCFHLH